jgi:hypothetical protein
MPNQILDRGHTANLGANIVHGNLNVIGVGSSYTISIYHFSKVMTDLVDHSKTQFLSQSGIALSGVSHDY